MTGNRRGDSTDSSKLAHLTARVDGYQKQQDRQDEILRAVVDMQRSLTEKTIILHEANKTHQSMIDKMEKNDKLQNKLLSAILAAAVSILCTVIIKAIHSL